MSARTAAAGGMTGQSARVPRYRALAFLLLCGVAALLAWGLVPRDRLADRWGTLHLARVVPERFGTWRVDTGQAAPLVSADVRATLAALYTETLERVYVDDQGRRIMLSVAYGRDQGGEGTQVHRPEFCYAAQGFGLSASHDGQLATAAGALPVRRLEARQGRRREPITYWVTVGQRATRPGLERKIAQLRYGLAGQIPDGLLVRVSSLDADAARAWAIHEGFIQALIAALPVATRARVAGIDGDVADPARGSAS